jgi:hypothetical protein
MYSGLAILILDKQLAKSQCLWKLHVLSKTGLKFENDKVRITSHQSSLGDGAMLTGLATSD